MRKIYNKIKKIYKKMRKIYKKMRKIYKIYYLNIKEKYKKIV